MANFGGRARLIGITTLTAATALVTGQAAPAWAAPNHSSVSSPSAAPSAAGTASAALESATRLFAQDGVISGTVDGPASVPLAGVCVTATGPAGARAVRTNSAGRYLLTGVAAGTYTLAYTDCADPDGYLAARYPAPVVVTGDEPALLGPVALTPATPAQAIATENAYTRSHQALAAAAAMRPLISGTVRSAAGRPLAGICVTALVGGSIPTPLGPEPVEAQWSSGSGAGGRYSIPSFIGLKGATIRVLFTDGCGNTGNYAPQYWRYAPIRHAATVLHQVSASTTFSGIDARLTRGGAVSGIVRGGSATGPGLAGVCVNASGRYDQSGIDLQATTGAGGRYTLVGLGTGPYQVWFAPGCGLTGNYIGARYGLVHASAGVTRTGVDGVLPVGATISGTVTSSQADDAPVSGICVSLSSSTGSTASATTGKSGAYSVDRLTAGSYYVYFSGGCGNTGSYAPQFFDDQSAAGAAGTVSVSAGGAATADASLQPGGTLAGRVTNPAGKPLGNVCVVPVSQLEDDVATSAAAAAVQSYDQGGSYNVLTTSSAGQYSEPNLAPGLYAVSFSPCDSDNSLGAAWFTGSGSVPAWISVSAGVVTDANVVLPRAGAITGTVTTTSGSKVDGICALAVPANEPELNSQTAITYFGVSGGAITGKSGRYKLNGLAPGTYTVTFAPCISSRPYAPAWYKDRLAGQRPTPVTVRAGQTTSGINAVLTTGKSVSGVIRSGISHRPIANACVLALPGIFSLLSVVTNPFALRAATTGKSGRFTLTHLAPGSYDLLALPCEGGPLAITATSLQVPSGSAAARLITLTLPRAGGISGTVSAPAADGGGAAACVIAEPVSPRDIGPEVAADYDGGYSLTNLGPGRYRIEFTSDCSNGTSQLAPVTVAPVTVTAGRITIVNAALPVVGSITGTVTSGGSPVADECVTAFAGTSTSAPAATAITGADGSYQIGFLAPGSYRVEFAAGCGATGYAPQWWNGTAAGAPTAAGGKPVSVTAATATSGVDAALAK